MRGPIASRMHGRIEIYINYKRGKYVGSFYLEATGAAMITGRTQIVNKTDVENAWKECL